MSVFASISQDALALLHDAVDRVHCPQILRDEPLLDIGGRTRAFRSSRQWPPSVKTSPELKPALARFAFPKISKLAHDQSLTAPEPMRAPGKCSTWACEIPSARSACLGGRGRAATTGSASAAAMCSGSAVGSARNCPQRSPLCFVEVCVSAYPWRHCLNPYSPR